MDWNQTLRRVLVVQSFLFIAIILSIEVLNPSLAEKFKVYELFGVVLASILTVFGILEMKQLTE